MRSAFLIAFGSPVQQERHLRAISSVAQRFGLATRLVDPELSIFTSPDLSSDTAADGSIILGRPIAKDNGMSPGTSRASGQVYSADYWGEYALVSHSRETQELMIERSVSPSFPVYHTRKDGLDLVASHISLLLGSGLVSGTIDADGLAHHLSFPHLRVARTCLAGVELILAGERLCLTTTGTRRRTMWTPWAFAGADRQVDNFEDAQGLVRAAVVQAVRGLVGPCQRAALELSGGLDSSILAAAIGTTGVRAQAVNLVTPSSEGDERRYARAVAEKIGLNLHEIGIDGSVDLLAPPTVVSPYPTLPAVLCPIDQRLTALAREHMFDAFVSGNGGDSVFGYPSSTGPAADALRLFGPGSRFLESVRAIAEMREVTMWRVARLALRQATRPPIHRHWPRETQFLKAARLPDRPGHHPWLAEPDQLLPGKRSHVRSVIAMYTYVDGYCRHETAPMIFPLLSQPVLEACLRVPTWMSVSGGNNRAVARAAFADQLPEIVIARRGKGRLDRYCAEAFEANRPKLKSFLLDGALARAGLLDRPVIEIFLASPPPGRDMRMFQLLPIIDTERWARSWES